MEPINVRLVDLGIVNGIHIFEVYDADTNEKIGYNKISENQEILNE
jgi:hypothetical protein